MMAVFDCLLLNFALLLNFMKTIYMKRVENLWFSAYKL